MRMRRRNGELLALFLLIMPGACKKNQASAQVPQAPPGEAWLSAKQVEESKISIVPLTEHEVDTAVVTSGRVTFDDQRVSHVFSPVAGRVVKVEAQLGQRVSKGAALAYIDSPDVGLASADLGKAQADLVAVEHELARLRELFEAHAGSQRDFEGAQDNFAKAKAELERARQKNRLLRGGGIDAVSQGYVLRSLIDGEVIARNVAPGMEVQGQYSGGTAVELFTIGDPDPIWILSDVFEMDLAHVKVGADVEAKVVAYPDRTFTGKVDWVSEALDPTTRTAKVRSIVKNGDRMLKPEMYASVTIDSEGHSALALPRSAVLHLGDQTVVFVESGRTPDGQLRLVRRPVAVDEDGRGDLLPVQHGLSRGDRVVVSGAILLAGMI